MGNHALETSSKFDTFGVTAADLSRKQAEKDLHKRFAGISNFVSHFIHSICYNRLHFVNCNHERIYHFVNL